jgi:hypothetical protein
MKSFMGFILVVFIAFLIAKALTPCSTLFMKDKDRVKYEKIK